MGHSSSRWHARKSHSAASLDDLRSGVAPSLLLQRTRTLSLFFFRTSFSPKRVSIGLLASFPAGSVVQSEALSSAVN